MPKWYSICSRGLFKDCGAKGPTHILIITRLRRRGKFFAMSWTQGNQGSLQEGLAGGKRGLDIVECSVFLKEKIPLFTRPMKCGTNSGSN
jgi:hypothetical protein